MSEQQEAKQCAESLIELIRTLMPGQSLVKGLAPVELQIISYNGSRGTGALRVGGKTDNSIVDFQAHPQQALAAGDAVVAVPLAVSSYFVVAKI